MKKRVINEKRLSDFKRYLLDKERSRNTIDKYLRDVRKLMDFANGKEITKELVVEFKEKLKSADSYEASSINTFLIAVNQFMECMEWHDAKVRTYKIQKSAFMQENRCITKEDYKKLVNTARKMRNMRLAMLLNVLCATGIRVSELRYFTVDNIRKGKIDIRNKGKIRTILIPDALQKELKCYVAAKHIEHGAVFCTKSGKPMDRSNIWKEMKALCGQAGVEEGKVFPHNLRHLFAQCFYRLSMNLPKLADILGHSSMETSRIYVRAGENEYRRILDRMQLVC